LDNSQDTQIENIINIEELEEKCAPSAHGWHGGGVRPFSIIWED